MKKSNQVLSTTDYKIFKKMQGNREMLQGHALELKKSRDQMNPELLDSLLWSRPVIVNEKYEVIDGQHNIEERRLSKKPVYYTIVKGAKISEVITLNLDVRKWGFEDFLNSHIDLGKKDYKIFKSFREKYQFPFTACLIILACPTTLKKDASLHRDFKAGNFLVEDFQESERLAEKIMDLLKRSHPTVKGSNAFFEASLFVIKKYPAQIDKIIEKSFGMNIIYRMSTRQEYIRHFEFILEKGNYGKPIRLI